MNVTLPIWSIITGKHCLECRRNKNTNVNIKCNYQLNSDHLLLAINGITYLQRENKCISEQRIDFVPTIKTIPYAFVERVYLSKLCL